MVMNSGRDGSQGDIRSAVALVYRPTRADIHTAVLVRERCRRLHLLRWGLAGLLAAVVLLILASPASAPSSALTPAVLAVLIWSLPHAQSHHALKTVSWQGEYRVSVSETGVSAESEHVTLLQRWSVFRGYRETRDHVVLLSRDPNILLVEVLPKRGLRSLEDTERLLDLVGHHLPRV
ncbi:YcxB family protein [Streptomyces gardneri]|uniref:YcxB family protein n=1 Tax=Streptomyces gardneri TaxID=66892 RepID=UPI0036760F8E